MKNAIGILLLNYMLVRGNAISVSVVSNSGNAIPACRICLPDRDTCFCTDMYGFATIYMCSTGCSLKFTASGYIDTMLECKSKTDSLIIKMEEKSDIIELAKIRVTASRKISNEHQIECRSSLFTSSEILNTAGSAGDISRHIATHPSVVASIGEGYDNTLYVRGGRPTEILFIVDGIEFDNINHFSKANGCGGPIGFINSEFIKKVNFFAGNMPVEYPSRLSSVIDVDMRNGSFNNYNGSIGIKLTGGMISLEGPLEKKSGNFVCSGRYIDFSTLSSIIKDKGIPKLGDLFTKLMFVHGDNVSIYLTGLFSYNHYKYDYPVTFAYNSWNEKIEDTNNEIEQIVQGGGGITLKYGKKTSQLANIAYSFRNGKRFDSLSEFSNEYILKAFEKNPTWINSNKKNKLIAKYGVRTEVGECDSISCGANVNVSSYTMENTDHSKYMNGTLDVSEMSKQYSLTVHGQECGCYLRCLLQSGIIKADFGLRCDYYGLLDKMAVSPSITIKIPHNNHNEFTLMFGIYNQFPSEILSYLFNLLSSGYGMSGDSLSNHELRLLKKVNPYRNFQYALGFKTDYFKNLFLQTEMYYKWYDKEFPFDSEYSVSIINYINGIPSIKEQNGMRKAMGIELMLKNDNNLWYHFSIGGSIFKVINKYTDGKWYNDWTNVGYTFTLSTVMNIKESHSVSLSATGMGGRPYTELRVEEDPVGIKYVHIVDECKWLKSRLDRIFYFNTRYSYKTKVKKVSIEGSVEILNILNLQPTLDYRFNGDGLIKVKPFGFTPVLGLTVGI